MNGSICGANCAGCAMKGTCKGCVETDGCPFNKQCFIAKYINIDGKEAFQAFKQKLMDEFNALNIPGLLSVDTLHPLVGSFINLEYTLPSGQKTKLLDDGAIYLANQLECTFGGDRCYGIAAGLDFLMVCTYGENGSDPELVLYQKR